MKHVVTQMAADRGLGLELGHHSPPKYIKKSLRGASHTYIPLASKVESPNVQVSGVRITNRALSPEEIRRRAADGVPSPQNTMMSFSQWMAAGVIEVVSGKSEHPHIQISRETLIKRIANSLGASHPAGTEANNPQENKFDPYIRELHALKLAGGYPATYYQLLEIAGELLSRAKCLRDSAT